MADRKPLVIAIALFTVVILASPTVLAQDGTCEEVSTLLGADDRVSPVVLVPCCEGGSRPGKGCGVDAACPGSCTSPATAAGDPCNGDNQCGRCEGATGSEPTHGKPCQTSSACGGACSNDPSVGCTPGSSSGVCAEGGTCEPVACVTGVCGDLGTCTGMCERPRSDITPIDPAASLAAPSLVALACP
jgi:hypothetical protein